jgi:hypothetical protein
MKTLYKILFCSIFCLTLVPVESYGCACGCGVFLVGTRWMMVTSTGPRVFLQYSYLDQSQNWSNLDRVSADLNSDKLITTSFYKLGMQYMVDRNWGMMIEAQVWDRYLRGVDEEGSPFSVRHSAPGDTRLMGMYTGVSEDMSTAIMAGIKLPTGPIDQSLLDRDTQIGTGTTDALLSAYQMGQENLWGWFVEGSLMYPLNERDGYKPGSDVNAAVGFHYDGLITGYRLAPIASVIASYRSSDGGPEGEPDNTGYTRIFFSPGVEIFLGNTVHFDFEFGIPLYSKVTGYQLVSPKLINTTLSYQF